MPQSLKDNLLMQSTAEIVFKQILPVAITNVIQKSGLIILIYLVEENVDSIVGY